LLEIITPYLVQAGLSALLFQLSVTDDATTPLNVIGATGGAANVYIVAAFDNALSPVEFVATTTRQYDVFALSPSSVQLTTSALRDADALASVEADAVVYLTR
jgi:hypothetical protein